MKNGISVIVPIPPASRMGGRQVEILPSLKQNKCIPILESGGTASENRNRGAKKAKTPLVAFANMHSILSKNWTSQVLNFFKKHPEIDMVGGPHLPTKDESYFGLVSSYALGSIFGAAEASARYSARKEMMD